MSPHVLEHIRGNPRMKLKQRSGAGDGGRLHAQGSQDDVSMDKPNSLKLHCIITLYYTALHSITLYTALYCMTLYDTVSHCITLYDSV